VVPALSKNAWSQLGALGVMLRRLRRVAVSGHSLSASSTAALSHTKHADQREQPLTIAELLVHSGQSDRYRCSFAQAGRSRSPRVRGSYMQPEEPEVNRIAAISSLCGWGSAAT
jgi:hypothetical protein